MYRGKFYFRVLIILMPCFLSVNSLKLLAFDYKGNNIQTVMPKDNSAENTQSGSFADYYVSKNGDDNNSGNSTESAWKTIAKVNSHSFIPGDRIHFRRGDEWREQLTIKQSGTADSRIVFTAYGTGAKPIINAADEISGWAGCYNNINQNIWGTVDPSEVTGRTTVIVDDSLYIQVATLAELTSARKYWIKTESTPDSVFIWSRTNPDNRTIQVSTREFGIYAHEQNYITISYLDVRNAGNAGIKFQGKMNDGFCYIDSVNVFRNRLAGIMFSEGFSHNLVTNCVATYNGNGILGWEGIDNTTFSHCYTAHGVHNYIGTNASADGTGYQFYKSTNVVIEYCESNDDAGPIFLDAAIRGNYNMIARYNYVHNSQANYAGIGINPPGEGGIFSIFYNLIVDCGGGVTEKSSLHIAGDQGGKVYIYNNTIYNPISERNTKGSIFLEDGTNNFVLKNNIVYYKSLGNFSVMAIREGESLISNYNLWYQASYSPNILFWINQVRYMSLEPWRIVTGQDLNSKEGDPLFVNSSSDWKLQRSSPCINAGVDVGLTQDILGNPIVGIPDIGAFESQYISNIPLPVYLSSTIENSAPARLELIYNINLANIVPAVSAFTVLVNSSARTVSSVAISGTKVILTLSSPVASGNVVTVAYTKPSANPLQTTAGGQAATISAQTVTNKVAAPPPPVPVYLSSAIENATPSKLEMIYSISLANIVPAVSAFTVLVNSTARTVSSVAISGTKVILTLASPVAAGNVVTVAYTKPSANPLQTTAGGQAATISAQPVTNKVVIVNSPPVVVVSSTPNNLSGFVGELDATGSYDPNNDNLSYTWVAPNNISVSSKTGSKIQFLSPIVNTTQKVDFTLHISDGKTTQSKVIPVEILPYKPELEVAEVLNVEASSFLSPNYPHNVLDGNIGTMWAVNGDNQWISLELKEPFNVHHVRLSFKPGQRNESYFDILGSDNNVTWEPVLTKSASCYFSGDIQVFEFPSSKSLIEFKFVKLVGQSNSIDSWNYISEFRIFGHKYRNPLSYEEQPVKIYPNPALDYINIRIDKPSLAPDLLKIISLSGDIVYQDKVNPDIREFKIPINFLEGIYIVQLQSNNLILFTQKLIVQ